MKLIQFGMLTRQSFIVFFANYVKSLVFAAILKNLLHNHLADSFCYLIIQIILQKEKRQMTHNRISSDSQLIYVYP